MSLLFFRLFLSFAPAGRPILPARTVDSPSAYRYFHGHCTALFKMELQRRDSSGKLVRQTVSVSGSLSQRSFGLPAQHLRGVWPGRALMATTI
jgi:hypothetical protein